MSERTKEDALQELMEVVRDKIKNLGDNFVKKPGYGVVIDYSKDQIIAEPAEVNLIRYMLDRSDKAYWDANHVKDVQKRVTQLRSIEPFEELTDFEVAVLLLLSDPK